MRTESEMFNLILTIAKEDDRILAVYMNGSRTNVNAPKDIFRDYDIVYVVKETKSFREDKTWIDRFGQRLFMQYPDEGFFATDSTEEFYGWLIQFADGNRLDLHVQTLEAACRDIDKDSLCEILLDKNGLLPKIPEASEQTYWVKKPSEEEFKAVCNEFWWCLDNVGKGLWREEIPYVQDMINMHIRPQLVKVLSWKAGILHDFRCSIGKSGKYLYRLISDEEWQRFLHTYAGYRVEDIWYATEEMCDLMDESAQWVAKNLDFDYNKEEADNCKRYLKYIKTLPKDITCEKLNLNIRKENKDE
ncbi:MAG: aminoglycoside 6-adenylyltransferase [Lachnospiraceae bacterium]|nr:aminoglycoside 6-adenylyltransferase [Lachnospiraceae bacterium]